MLSVEDADDVLSESGIILLPDSNYTINGNTIIPAEDYNGNLFAPAAISDGYVNSDTIVMTITVTPVNDAPVLTRVEPQSISEDNSLTLLLSMLVASDKDNTLDNSNIVILPGINYTSENTTVTPQADYNGALEVAITVTDGLDNSDTLVMNLTVTPENDVPVITSTAPANATVGEVYNYTVIATDVDNDQLTYFLSNNPYGMIINENIISWTPESGTTTSGEVLLMVSDGESISSETFTIAVENNNTANIVNNSARAIIYPNPVKSVLNIKSIHNVKSVSVISTTGATVDYFETFENSIQYNLEHLEKGMYILKIRTENGIISKTIIKE